MRFRGFNGDLDRVFLKGLSKSLHFCRGFFFAVLNLFAEGFLWAPYDGLSVMRGARGFCKSCGG